MTSTDKQIIYNQHTYLIVTFDDIFGTTSPSELNALRIHIKSIFDIVDNVELVIDLGQLQSFPDHLDVNDFRWETDPNSINMFS